MTHTIKGLREQFKAVGKFHTPPELALLLRSYIPGNPSEAYDPTCGAGALLSVFDADVKKYGQDIDAAALADAELLPEFYGVIGDVLREPAFWGRKFDAIVANPPFSIRWEPQGDVRFRQAPVIPTAGRADYAFLLHILHMLSDTGTAAVLSFPGVLYRGQREGKIRAWMIEKNYVDRVVHIPGNTFTDTTIATAVLVLRKNRADDEPVTFECRESGQSASVSRADIATNGYALSVSQYVTPPQPKREAIDVAEVEQQARQHTCQMLKNHLEFSRLVASFEGWPIEPFIADLKAVIADFENT